MIKARIYPGDLVRVPMSVRTYANMSEQDNNTFELFDKDDKPGFTPELAIVIGTEPATLLFIIGDRPRWRWIWPGNERHLVKETTAT